MTPEERAKAEYAEMGLDLDTDAAQWIVQKIADAIREAIAEEREACARVAETILNPETDGDETLGLRAWIASVIRRRSEFIALARNAFDVRMRRKWQSFWVDEIWVATYPEPMPLNMPPFFSADPDSCLVEADRWYAEHVEGKP